MVAALDRVRTAEVVAAVCLATDLGMGLPFEHGWRATLVGMRMGDRLGVEPAVARQTYYGGLLFYAGCTADAEEQARLFPEGALLEKWTPVMFGGARESTFGVLAALAAGDGAWPARVLRAAGRLPEAVGSYRRHLAALCEVTGLLAAGFGLPRDVADVLEKLTERWDGQGPLGRARGSEIPMAVRIIQVARDASYQALLRGNAAALDVMRARAGKAFDPDVVDLLLREPDEILGSPRVGSLWDAVLEAEPTPHALLADAGVDDALRSAGAFADLVSPDLTGHSAGVAELAGRAAELAGYPEAECVRVRRAGLVHDLGRLGVPFGVWQEPGGLSADGWEKVRLHAYHTERLLDRSPFLATLGAMAACHHERLDGSGYHRGLPSAGLTRPARLLAVADAYRTKTEPRPHRAALPAEAAAEHLQAESAAGRLDAGCVGAVLAAAGHARGPVRQPAGLTDRECQTLELLARGRATKQIARELGVTPKTADHYVQRVYAKIGVSTRAAAAVYAMQQGFLTWENSHS